MKQETQKTERRKNVSTAKVEADVEAEMTRINDESKEAKKGKEVCNSTTTSRDAQKSANSDKPKIANICIAASGCNDQLQPVEGKETSKSRDSAALRTSSSASDHTLYSYVRLNRAPFSSFYSLYGSLNEEELRGEQISQECTETQGGF